MHLVQDHEGCLWKDEDLSALAAAGCPVLHNYSISSLDLNAIEGWWHRLKQRLVEQAPDDLERRPEFLLRLRRTGHWMNEHWADDALYLCTNQKERARQGLSPDINGAKYEF